jgi:phenylalanyl-tRNA synthetase alpha chain
VGAVKSLLADEYVTAADIATSFYTISEEGQAILENGTQEMLVLKAIVENGKMDTAGLQSLVGNDIAKIGMGNCMKNKWVKKDGVDLLPLKTLGEVEDEVQKALKVLVDGNYATDAVDDKVRYTSREVVCLHDKT